jgi:hypothetical protein
MDAFQVPVKFEIAADHVGRRGQALEVVDREGSSSIREREQLVGLTPLPALAALASPLELRLEHISASRLW